MAFNPLDYLTNLVPEGTNMFGASPNANMKKMYDMGLLGDTDYTDMLAKANKQSIFQGLLSSGLSYLAQPKNQGYGSALPYLAKAGLAGVQAAQSPYDQMGQDAIMNQKLQGMQRANTEQETSDKLKAELRKIPEFANDPLTMSAIEESPLEVYKNRNVIQKRLSNEQRLADLITIDNDPNRTISPTEKAELDALTYVVRTTSPQGISGQDLLASPYGNPPDGYTWDRTPQGKLILDSKTNQPTVTPIAGTKVAEDRAADIEKKRVGSEGKSTIATTVVVDAQRALDLVDGNPNASGVKGFAMQKVPGTAAYALGQTLESIQSNIGIDKLLDIKASGAGLGQVPQSQLEMLASVLGKLSIGQPTETLRFNIDRVMGLYAEIVMQSGGQDAFDLAIEKSTKTPERANLIKENQGALDYYNNLPDKTTATAIEIKKILTGKGLL